MTKKTHDTKATLSNNLEPEQLYQPGFYNMSDRAGAQETPPAPVRPDNNEDISKTSLGTTTDYVGRLTSGDISHQSQRGIRKGNVFSLDKDLNYAPPGLKEHTTSNTEEPAASDIKRKGQTLGTFLDSARQLNSAQSNRFETTSMSQYGASADSGNPFLDDNPVIDKTRAKDGHVLLTGIKEEKKNSKVGAPAIFSDQETQSLAEVQKRISVVLSNNRFNSSERTPFMRNHARVAEGDRGTRIGATKQGELGRYIKDAEFILEEDLKDVAKDLMSNATGQGDIKQSIGPDGVIDVSKLPNLMRLTGWSPVNAGDMRAFSTATGKKVLSPSAGVNTSLLTGEGDENKAPSYGVLNSPYEPFSGPLPLSMVVNSLLGLTSLLAFSSAVVGLVRLFGGPREGSTGEGILPASTRPMDMMRGRHAKLTSASSVEILQIFKIPQLEHDFDLCVMSGILAFYGLEEFPAMFSKDVSVAGLFDALSGNLAINIFDKFANIAGSAGYYSVITRAASRDVNQIKDAIGGLNGNSIVGSVVQTFKVIDSIVESTTYKFLMTMAALGDKILSSIDGHPTLNNEIDSLPENARNRHSKSRVHQEKRGQTIGDSKAGRLAWRHAASPSRYILPASFDTALSNAAQTDANTFKDAYALRNSLPAASMHTADTAPVQDVLGESDLGDGKDFEEYSSFKIPGRLPKEYVRWVEDRLDAEFMPFYFHDIRTNEIISFHAFLGNLSDSYAADYTSTSAYGRGDDVKIYNKTTRSIGVKFSIVATNEKDMDVLYWNLNKLVSMVYPQWSRGRSVINGSGPNAEKFIQPFSQIPTASPLIRLRLGDVLTSNYSKFGLMRLFGVGESKDVFNLNINAEETTESVARRQEIDEINKKITKEAALRMTDPGASDPEQKMQLESFGLSAPDIAQIGVSGGDSQFGYKKGDKIIIDSKALAGGYWGRNSSGKLAKHIKELKKHKIAKTLHVYPENVEVEVVARIPDAADPEKPQNERFFGSHVQGVSSWGEIGSTALDQAEKSLADKNVNNFYGQMAYLVKVLPGSPADKSLGPNWPADMKYHRVLHGMVVGLAPSFYNNMRKKLDPEYTYTKDPGKLNDWFKSENNYIVRSFESAMGRGLAGFITSLNIDWNAAGATWEITPGMRAPKYLEVDIQFAPIHDIPLGLDSEGMMRSVPYNVGSHSNVIGQDPLDRKISSRNEIIGEAAGAAKPINDTSQTIRDKATAAFDKAVSKSPVNVENAVSKGSKITSLP